MGNHKERRSQHVEAYLCHLIPLMVGHITWSLRGHVLLRTSKRGMPRAAGRSPWRVSNRPGPFFTVGVTNIATKDLKRHTAMVKSIILQTADYLSVLGVLVTQQLTPLSVSMHFGTSALKIKLYCWVLEIHVHTCCDGSADSDWGKVGCRYAG